MRACCYVCPLKLHKLQQLVNEALISIGPSVHDARHSAVHGAWQCAVHALGMYCSWRLACAVHGAWQSVAFSLRTTSKHTLAITDLA